MAGSLWKSTNGIRRKGTSFKELQSIFNTQVTTRHIYEPLHCAYPDDVSVEIFDEMDTLDFDILGVVNAKEQVIGFIEKEDLKVGYVSDHRKEIDLSIVATDSTPIYRLIQILETRSFVFVMHGNAIDGIVTKADINKPIVRLYLFGIISLCEMHLNYWITHYYPNDSWKPILSQERLSKLEEEFAGLKTSNSALSLQSCTQLADKKAILCKTKDFLNQFNFSRTNFESLLRQVEKVRNSIAHSQEDIFGGLELKRFVHMITMLEEFLTDSEGNVGTEVKIPLN